MRSLYILFFSCATVLYSAYSSAQSVFSIGIKGGIGASLPDPNSSLDINGQSYSLRTHAFYTGGMLGQYVLGNTIGIETGILNTYQSYSRKDLTDPSLLQSLGWDANIGVNSYQIPIQFMYMFRMNSKPNMRFKLTGGIAMDWHTQGFLKKQENPAMVSSILFGARIKNPRGKYGRIEYGLEYQYSLNGNYTFDLKTDQGTQTLHTRYSVLSFNLYYFFFNKHTSNTCY
ncbi:hypothetical protein [Cytophaga aurantiaca]|uniref:hypothetical protein n=1 Tax=Cytophaga aurantiaca TaxID=29530 RepID=UPI00037D4D95|nr:hypothetical protein [Cytophaga aurantiaca]